MLFSELLSINVDLKIPKTSPPFLEPRRRRKIAGKMPSLSSDGEPQAAIAGRESPTTTTNQYCCQRVRSEDDAELLNENILTFCREKLNRAKLLSQESDYKLQRRVPRTQTVIKTSFEL